ncbi:MAG: hypothetical protein A2V52_01145 [Actinobacteria bacterium RBG_19FT_COMBO_54_7]|uniref:AB hydrolase-1 domain-containing protein n=1 Tax=Candidatus Solincola sediminis TaxID=1797199 RepID=A0A1F2WNQ9_9ACTN|nr:MAG: hypothetical protein A2Y75_02765 [Candidatus Solincola sediminis]OFW59545.1 MAG: hypothetical protein A2W01_06445 [Candidatus Solincola sediminis]OFW68711.1 MAG: hypothetical protein A2V52_01145 [Actinobacteria bacterium RBG_19FT_COMBO_54_7]
MKGVEGEAEINGITIHYRSYGQGDPLLLVMGLGGNIDWWSSEFLEALAEHFQIVAFDNRGAGRSEKAAGPYSIPQMATDAAELIKHMGWSSANVAGLSMGGMIAQELALDYPDKVRSLILMCTTSGGSDQVLAEPEIYSILDLPRENFSDEQIARVSLYLLFPRQFIDDNPDLMEKAVDDFCIAPISPDCFQSQLQAVASWSVHARLCDLKHRTLIICGNQDRMIPPRNSMLLHDLIPDSRLVQMPGGGHGLTSMYPEEVAAEIIGFLS